MPPLDPDAIDVLVKAYMDSKGEITVMLRALFNSEFFKNARFKKVKSPTELIAGVLKQTGEYTNPVPGLHEFAVTTLNGSLYEGTMAIMGQRLMNPPTVEGWHTGHEWIDSGTLSERIGFVERQFADQTKPGVQDIIARAGSLDDDPSKIVDRCLDLMGAVQVSEATYDSMISYTKELKDLKGKDDAEGVGVHNILQMLASTVDYQFA